MHQQVDPAPPPPPPGNIPPWRSNQRTPSAPTGTPLEENADNQPASQVETLLKSISMLPEKQQHELWNHCPSPPGHAADFDSTFRLLVNSVVSVDHIDENDLKTLADSFMDSLGRLCAHIDLSPFAIQVMSRGVDEGQVDREKIADAILQNEKINTLLWKAPTDLNPDDIQKLERGHQEKISKCIALNKLMVQEIVSWICSNLPAQFKKAQPEYPEKRKAPVQTVSGATEQASKLPRRTDFDFGNYSLQNFEQDAASLTRTLPGTSLLSAKEASKEQPFDSNAPWNADAVKFDTALERLGVEGQIRESVYGAFKMATQNIGLKCDKRQTHELRRWVARALALKHQSTSE
eukprot:s1568_g6.t1